MGKKEKLLQKAINSPNNFAFTDLCKLAELHGYKYRDTRGDHKTYRHPVTKVMMNFQPDKNNKKLAKPYQITQLLTAINEK